MPKALAEEVDSKYFEGNSSKLQLKELLWSEKFSDALKQDVARAMVAEGVARDAVAESQQFTQQLRMGKSASDSSTKSGGGERRGACVAHVHMIDFEIGHGRQRARGQPLRQPLHAVGAGCWLDEVQQLERWQHRSQRAQQRQLVRGEAIVVPVDPLRLAQRLAAPQPHLAAQRCGSLVISPQLLPRRLRQRPQLAAGTAEGHGDARIEHVAQLAEDDAQLVTAQRRERHRGARHVA